MQYRYFGFTFCCIAVFLVFVGNPVASDRIDGKGCHCPCVAFPEGTEIEGTLPLEILYRTPLLISSQQYLYILGPHCDGDSVTVPQICRILVKFWDFVRPCPSIRNDLHRMMDSHLKVLHQIEQDDGPSPTLLFSICSVKGCECVTHTFQGTRIIQYHLIHNHSCTPERSECRDAIMQLPGYSPPNISSDTDHYGK
jgi:hypothetical protein